MLTWLKTKGDTPITPVTSLTLWAILFQSCIRKALPSCKTKTWGDESSILSRIYHCIPHITTITKMSAATPTGTPPKAIHVIKENNFPPELDARYLLAIYSSNLNGKRPSTAVSPSSREIESRP